MSIFLPEDSGVTLSGKLPPLHTDSWFEAPCLVHATIAPMNLIQIGAFTLIGSGRIGHCKIGRYCSIANGVDIASDQHPTDWLSSSMVQYVPNVHGWGDWLKRHNYDYNSTKNTFLSNSTVDIGDVWIGQGVFIKSGVKIGDGAIIGAHSVVINDIPPYSIAVGVPAVVKKKRFDELTIEKLLELKWWDYNIAAIENVDFNNVSLAMDQLEFLLNNNRIKTYSPITYRYS